MFPLVSEDCDDPIVKPVFARLRERWGAVLNLYRILAWAPPLMQGWAAFAWTLRFDLAASRRLRELLVIRIASLLEAEYEYQHHLHMALDEGVTLEQVTALAEWRNSALFDAGEQAVLALADDLALSRGASSATMQRLRDLFAERECLELVVTGSFYCGVAKILASTGVQLEAGHAELRAR